MIRLFLAAFVWVILPTFVAAQDLCTTVTDLSRLFSTLQSVGEQGGYATPGQIQSMRAAGSRYDEFSVNYTIENSPLESERAIVNAAYQRAHSIQADLAFDGARSTLATLHSTRTSFSQALAVLGRLDCAPPVGDATELGTRTALPRSSNAITAGLGIGTFETLKWAFILMGSAIAVALCGVGIFFYQERAASIRRRYDCNLATSFILPGPTPTLVAGHVVDISRSGVKIRVDGQSGPKNGDRLSLLIDTVNFPIQIRWQNSHYFGGTFNRTLGRTTLKDLINTKAVKSKRRKKKDRGGSAAPTSS